MSGSPKKAARAQVWDDAYAKAMRLRWPKIDEAINKAGITGDDPVDIFLPIMLAHVDKALEGDMPAIKEIWERSMGKVQQEIKVDRDSTVHVDAGLLGSIGDLLKLVHGKREEKVVLEIPPQVEKK
jgi:hypothetical protein